MSAVMRARTGMPISKCHGAEVEVTRVVHDVISYVPQRLEPGFLEPLRLVVAHGQFKASRDSDEFVVRCSMCGAGLSGVEVEEQ